MATKTDTPTEAKSVPIGDPHIAPATTDGSGVSTQSLVLNLGLPIGLVLLLYWNTLVDLVNIWEIDPNYSHGYLVPLLSAFFVWRAWQRHGPPVSQRVSRGEVMLGVTAIVVGVSLHFLAWFLQHLLYDVLSLTCVLVGILCFAGGRRVLRTYGFAAFFLIFMAPLPVSWHQPIALTMQNLASVLSSFVMNTIGVPVYREGYFLHFPGYTAEVGEACSGLGQITVFLMLTVAAGHLGGRSLWSRMALIISSFPIALFANTLRIVVTGLIAVYIGPKWTQGIFHTLEGVAVAAIGLVLVYLTNVFLGKLEQSKTQKPRAKPSPAVAT